MPEAAILQAGDAPIEFIDLGAQRRRLGRRVDEAILRVVDHGKYIMGPEVAIFEQELAAFCGAKHVLSCANGTDALGLALMAKGIKPGQAVLVPSFTFAATAEVVAWFDAVPVFVDVLEHTFNMDPASLEAGHRDGQAPRARAGRDHPGRPVRSAGRLRRDPGDRRCAPAVGHLRRGAEFWRGLQGPQRRDHRRHYDDQLLPREAARLLRRWRRRLHRR